MATYSLITRTAKGSKLSIEEMDNNLLYFQQSITNISPNYRSMSFSSNNAQIRATDSTIFLSINASTFSLLMPSPEDMIGKELLFVLTATGSTCTLNGTFSNSTFTYISSNVNSVRYISNGTYWYVI